MNNRAWGLSCAFDFNEADKGKISNPSTVKPSSVIIIPILIFLIPSNVSISSFNVFMNCIV